MTIKIGAPRVVNNILLSQLDVFGMEYYAKSGLFKAKYTGVDLQQVPASILNIPIVGAYATTAMALGVPIYVSEIDAAFADSVDQSVDVWREMYPKFARQGFALIGERKINEPASLNSNGDLILYSGGVDALTSMLSNKGTVAEIASVWGADVKVGNEDLWGQLIEVMDGTAAIGGLPRNFIKTNLRRFVASRRMSLAFCEDKKQSWWMKAQHGNALLSCAAPVAFVKNMRRIIIASSHSSEFHEPWGSSPKTDEMLRFAGTTVSHDSYHLSRQQKISKVIAPEVRAGKKATIAVCYKKKRGKDGINCGKCEKCGRTAVAFLAADVDPLTVGVPLNLEFLSSWKTALSDGARRISANEHFMWTDIQKELRRKGVSSFGAEASAILEWVRDFDFGSILMSREEEQEAVDADQTDSFDE